MYAESTEAPLWSTRKEPIPERGELYLMNLFIFNFYVFTELYFISIHIYIIQIHFYIYIVILINSVLCQTKRATSYKTDISIYCYEQLNNFNFI